MVVATVRERARQGAFTPPEKAWPTMYDLPSEDPEEPGLSDDFHYYQPQLLRESLRPPKASEQLYIGSDINLALLRGRQAP